MSTNLIACRPASYGEFEAVAIEHMASVGIKNAEISIPENCTESKELIDFVSRTKEELEKFGVKCSSVAGGVDLSDPAAVTQKCSNLLVSAEAFGAPLIFLSVKSGGRSMKECYGILNKLGDAAHKNKSTFVLETHPDLVTNGDIAVETMRGVKHPNVMLNYDCANLYYYNEGIDHIAELKKMLPWVGAVHLKESCGKPKTWWFPGLHEAGGIINFPEIFRICNKAGFYGPFTMEIEGIEGEKLTKEIACARVADSMKYLKSIGVI